MLKAHIPIWDRLKSQIAAKRLSQALLFLGPRHANLLTFANDLIKHLLCEGSTPSCGQCKACHLLSIGSHQDVQWVQPERDRGGIQIEQIRALQSDAFHTPSRGAYRIIVVNEAEKLNRSSANALLKILEEPPPHLIFMLIAEHLSTLPATLLSRCQRFVFNGSPQGLEKSYLSLVDAYPSDSKRHKLFEANSKMFERINDLNHMRCTPCDVAAEWSSFDFTDLIWILYLMTAEAIRYQQLGGVGSAALIAFSRAQSMVNLFKQLDKIHAIMRKTNQMISMNQTLMLEDLLLGYLPEVPA